MTRPLRFPLLSFISLIMCSLLLTACGGGYVDAEGGSFVDKETTGGFERDTAPITTTPKPLEPVVLNATSSDFVPPPQETVQGPTPVPYEESFVGKNAVSAWVWNDRGSQKVFLPDGAELGITKLGITLEVKMIAPSADSGGAAVVFVIDGKQLPAAHKDEQIRVGRTYIYVKDIYVK